MIGVTHLIDRRVGSALTMILLGAWFLAVTSGWMGLTYGNSWSLVLVAVGVGIVMTALTGEQRRRHPRREVGLDERGDRARASRVDRRDRGAGHLAGVARDREPRAAGGHACASRVPEALAVLRALSRAVLAVGRLGGPAALAALAGAGLLLALALRPGTRTGRRARHV